MAWRHKDIPEAELHNPKGFGTANNGDSQWKNEKGENEWDDRDVLPAALSFVDGSLAPPTENTGDIYVLFSGGSVHADWDGIAIGDWARFDGTTWNSITPSESIVCYNKTGNALFAYNGSVWESVGGGDNIANANLTFDGSYTADLNGNSWTIEEGATSLFTIDSSSIELLTDTLVKGSDTSASTTGLQVTASDDSKIITAKNNGRINFGKYTTELIGNDLSSHFIGTSGRSTVTTFNSKDFVFENKTGVALALLSDSGRTNSIEFSEGGSRSFIDSQNTKMNFYNNGSYYMYTVSNSHTVYGKNSANSTSIYKTSDNSHIFTGGSVQLWAEDEATNGNVNNPRDFNIRTAYKTTGGVAAANNIRISAVTDNVGNYELQIKNEADTVAFSVNGTDALPVAPEFTVAGVPVADAENQGGFVMITDETGGYTMAFSDGTDWRRVQDRAIIS